MITTWGIDLSTEPKKIGVAKLDWDGEGPAQLDVRITTSLDDLVDLILAEHDHSSAWGIDVPFGWPVTFGRFLEAHVKDPTPLPSAVPDHWLTSTKGGRVRVPSKWSALAARTTDYRAREQVGIASGFNVSFDKLGATAAAWAYVEHGLFTKTGMKLDRTGASGRIFETWPSAAWHQFTGRAENPSTLTTSAFAGRLERVVQGVEPILDSLTKGARPHVQDAIVCALVARAHDLGVTVGPEAEEPEVVKAEGWIHLPERTVRLKSLVPIR